MKNKTMKSRRRILKNFVTMGLLTLSVGTSTISVFAEDASNTEIKSAISNHQVTANEVSVSTDQELRDALQNESITDINLTNNITLTTSVSAKGLTKNIHGNNFSIDMQHRYVKLNTINAKGTVENLQIKNTDVYGLLWSDLNGIEITYRNVEHEGYQLIYIPNGTLILDGTVNSNCNLEEVYQGKNLTILANAKIDFTSTSLGNPAISMLYNDGVMDVQQGATLNINSNAISISGGYRFSLTNSGTINATSTKKQAIHLSVGSTMDFLNGSNLKAVAGDSTEEALEATSGSIFVRSGATFDVESSGHQGSIITGGVLAFEKGSNFSVVNHNPNGAVFGSYAQTTSVDILSDTGIQTWDRGFVDSEEPTNSYSGDFIATFDLYGYENNTIQSNLYSNNTDFQKNYMTGDVGKITGGSFVATNDYSLTADDYTVNDDKLTGTYGKDVQEVHLIVNGEDIGTAILNNGKYEFTDLSGKITANDTVKVQALNSESTQVNEVTVNVKEETNKITHLDNYSISTSGGWIRGTYEGSEVARMQVIVDGTLGGSVPVKDGVLQYYAGNLITSTAQTVQVQILDASGIPLDTQVLTVTK